jgi:hypothetical protein
MDQAASSCVRRAGGGTRRSACRLCRRAPRRRRRRSQLISLAPARRRPSPSKVSQLRPSRFSSTHPGDSRASARDTSTQRAWEQGVRARTAKNRPAMFSAPARALARGARLLSRGYAAEAAPAASSSTDGYVSQVRTMQRACGRASREAPPLLWGGKSPWGAWSWRPPARFRPFPTSGRTRRRGPSQPAQPRLAAAGDR